MSSSVMHVCEDTAVFHKDITGVLAARLSTYRTVISDIIVAA